MIFPRDSHKISLAVGNTLVYGRETLRGCVAALLGSINGV